MKPKSSLLGDATSPSPSRGVEFFISFDGQQIRLQTDVPAVQEFVEGAFSLMLVPSPLSISGECLVSRRSDGIEIRMGDETRIWGLTEADAFELIKSEVLAQFIRSRKDLLWLHAGAAEKNGKALLLPAGAGHGKSTLVTLLIANGWRLLSDETAPVSMESDAVIGYPVRPQRRRGVGQHLLPSEVDVLPREIVEIPASSVTRECTHVCAIVFPKYETGVEPSLQRISQGDATLKLLRSTTNFGDLKDLAVGRATELARRIRAYELFFADGAAAAALLESLPLR